MGFLKFESEGNDGFSSSIVDLFDSLRSPITFLQDLQWSDEYQEARFFTSLAKVSFVFERPNGSVAESVFRRSVRLSSSIAEASRNFS